MAAFFDVGPYFNTNAHNIIKGVIPSAQFKRVEYPHTHSIMLLAFVSDFAAIYDSTNAVIAHGGESPVDLSQTLQYKLLITCGNQMKVNKISDSQVTWVEETRSVMLEED